MTVNGKVVAWYPDALVKGADDRLLGHTFGNPDGQQVWEVLGVLLCFLAPSLARMCSRGSSTHGYVK